MSKELSPFWQDQQNLNGAPFSVTVPQLNRLIRETNTFSYYSHRLEECYPAGSKKEILRYLKTTRIKYYTVTVVVGTRRHLHIHI